MRLSQPQGRGASGLPAPQLTASGGSRGLQRVLRKAGGRKTPQPYPKSPGLGPGPRPLLSVAVGARRPSSPAPDFAPGLSPRPWLSPCGGRAASSAAARLWVAQRPTGPRTAGEARGHPSHPRRSRRLPRSSHHRVHGLRERRTPKPPRPLPRPALAWTPPSGARAPRARSPAPSVPPCACANLLGLGPASGPAPAL